MGCLVYRSLLSISPSAGPNVKKTAQVHAEKCHVTDFHLYAPPFLSRKAPSREDNDGADLESNLA